MQHTVGATANNEVLENLRLELRRGCLILAVLAELRSERYGYTLRKALAQQVPCIRCYAGWRTKGCWPASGGKRTSATSGSTVSPPRAN